MSKALDNVAALRRIIYANEPSFGGLVSGGNNTAALQAAINAAQAVNGELRIPSGTWDHDGLTITGNITIRGEDQTKTVLRTRSGTNAHGVTIPVTTGVVQNPVIENLTIDGNRAGNLSTGHTLYLPDNPEPSATVAYGFSVVLRNVYMQNARETCLYVGQNRNMGHVENSELKRGGRCLFIDRSSDWRFVHVRFAFPLATYAVEVFTGADNVFNSCSMFGATLADCVLISSTWTSPTKLIGCTINFNQMNGVRLLGNGSVRNIGHVIQGCWFESNGLAADNTYSDIVVSTTRGAIIVGNTFRWNGTAVKPKHLVEFAGPSARVQWANNSWDDTSDIPFATSLSNTPTLLQSRISSLVAESLCYLGGAGDAYSLFVQTGSAGGNFVQIQGRASGVGPDVTAQGVDSNVRLRLSSKGAESVDILTGGLNRRAARFLDVSSAVNELAFSPSATGNPVQISATGTDTNIGLQLVPKGTGVLRVPIANVADHADDAAAAVGGVPVGGFYRTGSTLKIRAA